MRLQHLFRRIAKWVGTFFSALILTAWVLSVPIVGDRRLVARRFDPTGFWVLKLDEGAVVWVAFSSFYPSSWLGWELKWYTLSNRPWGWSSCGFRRPVHSKKWPGLDEVILPLWLPLAVVGVPTALLWWKYPQPPKGHCRNCGYNLTGNVSGICPECGEPIKRPARGE